MSKLDSMKSFIGKEIVVEYIQRGTEEITGEIVSVKDGIFKIKQEFRGSTYVYRIPSSEVLFAKGDAKADFAKEDIVTLERSVNKRVKIKGTLVGFDALGLILDRGEVRGKMLTQVVSANTFESFSFGELTAAGKKARAAATDPA